MSMSDDEIFDPSGDDILIRPRCRWCWLVASLLVAATGVLLVALWWTATKPEVNAFPVWCAGFDLNQRVAQAGLGDLLIPPARAQQNQAQAFAPANLGGPAGNRIEQHVLQRIAQADGSRIAYEMLDDNPVGELTQSNDAERRAASIMFEQISRRNGVTGFYRLALAHLGPLAFDIAAADTEDRDLRGHDRLTVPFCPDSEFVEREDSRRAFKYLVWAEDCRIVHPPLFDRWMEAVVRESRWTEREVARLEAEARTEMERVIKNKPWNGNRRAFCIGSIITPDDPPPGEVRCDAARIPREALKLGDAAQALGDLPKARGCWRDAIRLAQLDPDGAPAALVAQQRLQANASTCKPTAASLATISRDYRARSGDLIHMKVIQQALKALGHYDGPIDGALSPITRAAIRKFQRSVGEDETDTLTPRETTQLICNSAETTRDLVSVTTLGVMYAVGLGVEQNVDQAQQWLVQASNRRYPDATYNLSILYGTGILLNSYRLCDVPRMPEQADRYLAEAADQGHPIARALLQLYGPTSKYASLSPRERWTLIEMQQLENSTADRTGIYATKLAIVGAKCAPDRSIR